MPSGIHEEPSPVALPPPDMSMKASSLGFTSHSPKSILPPAAPSQSKPSWPLLRSPSVVPYSDEPLGDGVRPAANSVGLSVSMATRPAPSCRDVTVGGFCMYDRLRWNRFISPAVRYGAFSGGGVVSSSL